MWHDSKNSRWHMRTFHKDLFRCSYRLCGTYFRSQLEKQKHQKLVHATKNKQKCVYCGLFVGKQFYKIHLDKIHKSRKIKCKKVKKVALARQDFECIYCNKVCSDKRLLSYHVRDVHSDIKIQCKFFKCARFFLTETDCQAHFEQVHRKIEDEKLFRCSKCDYRSGNLRSFKGHVADKHGAKNIPCPKCAKFFGSAKALRDHLKSHLKPEICQHCNVECASKHLRSHQSQSKCKKCQQLLLCLRSAMLHRKMCKT